MRKAASFFVLLAFVFNCVMPPAGFAQALVDLSKLPQPGVMVGPSQVFTPALLRGLVIHPDAPLQFDFIVDSGDEDLTGEALSSESQRMINYFLASLTVPAKDLWVNLSPVEKDRIIADDLGRTELGRTLLEEDYILKQLTASLIYPEKGLGQQFWQRVYEEAYQKFGVTEVPVDVFNKVWIVPEKASVIEKGNTVYITRSHLKVMLEADYVAMSHQKDMAESLAPARGLLMQSVEATQGSTESQALVKQILREVIVPAIEKEVNEGKNFAQLRQVFHALVLAQWYQDVFKESVLNKVYSGKAKVAGIDLSDPKNKELIYQQYLAAYKKGVFSYIKEETDRLTNEPMPRKYFSGGFSGQGRVQREAAQAADVPGVSIGRAGRTSLVKVKVGNTEAAMTAAPLLIPHRKWDDLSLPLTLHEDLEALWAKGILDEKGLLDYLKNYSAQVEAEARKGYPVQGAWPVTKAITLLTKEQEEAVVEVIRREFPGRRPILADAILLMNNVIEGLWLQEQASRLVGKKILLGASEIHLWVGGLGPVMHFDLKGLKELGADAESIEPDFQLRRDLGNPDGDRVRYEDLGVSGLSVFDTYIVPVGDKDGKTVHQVKVQVRFGTDENGVPGYYIRDVQDAVAAYQFAAEGLDLNVFKGALISKGYLLPIPDQLTGDHGVDPQFSGLDEEFRGQFPGVAKDQFRAIEAILRDVLNGNGPSFYMRMPYNYGGRNNPVTKRESMAFLSASIAEFINRHPPDIVLGNDGQFGPLQATTMSRHKLNPAVSGIVWEYRTHTYDAKGEGNRGESWDNDWEINVFLKHMLGLDEEYIGYAVRDGHIDDTSLGTRSAAASRGLVTAVSNNQADDMGPLDGMRYEAVTNGAAPTKMARVYRQEFNRLKAEGRMASDADYERPTPEQDALTKVATKEAFNLRRIKSSNGRFVRVDPSRPLVGCARRLVRVKINLDDAWHEDNIWELVRMGADVVLMGNHQGTDDSEKLAVEFRRIEKKIAEEQASHPDLYPGSFYFVEAFSGDDKVAFEAAADLQVQASKEHTGAAEFSEEDITSNGGNNAGPRYGGRGEGVINAQGIEAVVEERDGRIVWVRLGQTWIPAEDTHESWLKTVYKPIMALWKQDPQRIDFYRGAALSPRLNRIQNYRITSAVMLRLLERAVKAREFREDPGNSSFGPSEADFVLHEAGVRYKFRMKDGEASIVESELGLAGFVEAYRQLQAMGQDGEWAIAYHAWRNDILTYLVYLFGEMPLALRPAMEQLVALNERSAVSDIVADKRRLTEEGVAIVEKLIPKLRAIAVQAAPEIPAGHVGDLLTAESAMANPGGIDVRNIGVDRQGEIMTGVMTDQALEAILTSAAGLRGIITGITPIQDLSAVLGLTK